MQEDDITKLSQENELLEMQLTDARNEVLDLEQSLREDLKERSNDMTSTIMENMKAQAHELINLSPILRRNSQEPEPEKDK